MMAAEANIPGVIDGCIPDQGDTVFPCFCCGVCCSDYQPHLDRAEAQLIADRLGVSLQQFFKECTDPRWPGIDTHLLLHKDGMCLFLEKKEGINKWLCRIHDFKPAACREWAAGLEKQECRKGLQRHWGLSVDNSGKLTGTSEDLAGFLNFLKTLD